MPDTAKDPEMAQARTSGSLREQGEKTEGQQPVQSPLLGASSPFTSSPLPWPFRFSRTTTYVSVPRPLAVVIIFLLAYVVLMCLYLLQATLRSHPIEGIVHNFTSSVNPPPPHQASERDSVHPAPPTEGAERSSGKTSPPTIDAEHASVKPLPPNEDTEPVARVISWEGIPAFSLERKTEAHVAVTYQTWGINRHPGLINQHIAHEQALMLAAALRAEKVLWPPSRERSSFNSRTEQVDWTTVDSSVMYDMDHITSFAKKQYGVEVVAVPSANYNLSYTPPPGSRAGGYVALLDPSGEGEVPGTQVVLSRKIRQGYNDLQDIAEHASERIEKLIQRHGKTLKHTPQVVVVLDIPFFMLSYAPEGIAVPITRNLRFAKNLRKLAETAVDTALNRTGAAAFNGLHLRVEEDATSFLKRVGGECGMRVLHNAAMEAAGFNAHEPVIVASGVFSMSTMSPTNLDKTITYSSDILGNKYASKILTKEMLLKPELLEPLGGEERAAVDWLILKEARLAVGWAASTFSISAREARIIEGKDPESMRLVKFEWNNNPAQVPKMCRQQNSNQTKQRNKKKSKRSKARKESEK